jgi:hypothetical protein
MVPFINDGPGGGEMSGLSKKIVCSVFAILAGSIMADARELGDFGQYLRGVSIGDPVGAAPPAGLYFENTTLLTPELRGNGQFGAVNVNVISDTPVLLWSTGWTMLGANVSMTLVQPSYNLTAWNSATSGPPFTGATFYPTLANTFINPISLSWNLGSGWFASTGFALYVPDGSRYNNTVNPDYWTYETHAAVSYLANGWDLTAHFVYDFNTASAGHTGVFAATPLAPFGRGYRSGDQAFLDLTATKKFGKWEIGPVAYSMWQPTLDRPGGGFSCATLAATTGSLVTCGRSTDYAIGGLIGYDFGLVNLKLFFTQSVYTRDDVGGFAAWTKLSFRLWAPEAPAPAAKALIYK